MMKPRLIPLYCISDSCRDSGIQKNTDAVFPPLALGMLVAFVRSFPDVWNQYELVPTVIALERTLKESFHKYGPGVYLFSDYNWTINKNLELSKLAKELSWRSITIHGGPSVPKYADACQMFLDTHPYIDVAVRGEGEHSTLELLQTIPMTWGAFNPIVLSKVAGVTVRASGPRRGFFRTADRPRQTNIDSFPSPYLTGVFDLFGNVPQSWTAAIIETNRGCPYGCTFCDWGSATLQKIYKFPLDRVFQEIEWAAKRQVPRLWIADANFGIFDRDVDIAEKIGEMKSKYGYPRDVIVNYAKNATGRLAEIIRIFKRSKLAAVGIISIQTQDALTLSNVQRTNIKTDRYEELIEIFRTEGLPVSSDLLIGLPGATITAFKNDLQFFIDRHVHTVAYPLMVLPNSPMGESTYMERFGIKLDDKGYIVSTNSFSTMDLLQMKMMFTVYRGAVSYSILKYLIYYLQVNNGIKASDFIHALTKELMRSNQELVSARTVLMRHCLGDDRSALLSMSRSDWQIFHAEISAFARKTFGVSQSSATDTVLTAQIALMPRRDRIMPDTVTLDHDVVAYFDQFRWMRTIEKINQSAIRPLEQFGAAEFSITDPYGFCGGAWVPLLDLHHAPQWELHSLLMENNKVPTYDCITSEREQFHS